MNNKSKYKFTYWLSVLLVTWVNILSAQVNESPNSSEVKSERTYNSFEFGLKILPSFATFTMLTYSGESTKGTATHGYGYGVSLQKNFSKHVGADLEVIYNSYSKVYIDNNLNREVNIKYINVPLLICLSTNKTIPVNLNVVLGPQIGLNAGSDTKILSTSDNDTLHGVLSLKQSDIDLVYGAGVDFSFSKSKCIHAGIGFRGSYGLTNIGNTNQKMVKGSYPIIDVTNLKTYSGYFSLNFGF